MTIGVDGFPFQENPSGIGKYLLSLIKSLMEVFPNAKFIFYSNKNIELPEEMLPRAILRIDNGIYRHLNPTVWLKTIGGKRIANDHVDFYISGAGFLPKLNSSVFKIAVIHDLNYKIVPQTMSKLHFLSHYFFLKQDANALDFIITNSIGTKNKIKEYFNLNANCIINPPTESKFKRLSESEINTVLRKYNINFPYFLTVGTLEPRKNLPFTIQAFLDFQKNTTKKNQKLVIVGANGWKDAKIMELCDSNKENIIRLGYVDENDLPSLYNGASAFLFPSLYEGFGMPVREALYCGCPVITTDIEELREASHGIARFIQPGDSDNYVHALLQSLESQENQQDTFMKVESDLSPLFEFIKSKYIGNGKI